MYTFSKIFTKEIWTFVCIMLLCQGCCFIRKNTKKIFSSFIVPIMRPSSTLKFQFVFDFNECLWKIFSLLNFKNCWSYIWVVIVDIWLSILWHKWLQVTSYHMSMNKKLKDKGHQIYITKCWERSVRRKSNINFIRVIKGLSFDIAIYAVVYYGLNLSKYSLVTIFCSSLRTSPLFRHGISTFSMLGSIYTSYI